MRKKPLSLLEFPSLQRQKSNKVRRQSDLIDSNSNKNKFLFLDNPFLQQGINSKVNTSIKIKNCSLNQSKSCKNAVKADPKISKSDKTMKKSEKILKKNLNSLEECRQVFTEIIKTNQKYGKVLEKIKKVYEENLLQKAANRPNSTLAKRKNSYQKLLNEKNGKNFNLRTSPLSLQMPTLTLEEVPRPNFHEEFMSNLENFSESWRKLILK